MLTILFWNNKPIRLTDERWGHIVGFVVIYRESVDDGFVITAFLTKRPQWFTRRVQLWP